MRKAANVAVNNYARLETDCKKQWNFHNSFFFAGTLATTIGIFHRSRLNGLSIFPDQCWNSEKDTATMHLQQESAVYSVAFSLWLGYLISLIWYQLFLIWFTPFWILLVNGSRHELTNKVLQIKRPIGGVQTNLKLNA